MKLFVLYFRTAEKDYNPERRYVTRRTKVGPDIKYYLNSDGGYLVMEDEIKKFWELGGGIDRLTYVGELDDNYFKPTLTEPDFVDEQIKSKKNGEIIGYQG